MLKIIAFFYYTVRPLYAIDRGFEANNWWWCHANENVDIEFSAHDAFLE